MSRAETPLLVATATLSAGSMRPGQVHTFRLTLAPRRGREAAMAHLQAVVESGQLTFAPVEGVIYGPVTVTQGQGARGNGQRASVTGRLELRATVTAGRRREDFTLEADLHVPGASGERGEPARSAPRTLSFSLPLRWLPNAAAAVA